MTERPSAAHRTSGGARDAEAGLLAESAALGAAGAARTKYDRKVKVRGGLLWRVAGKIKEFGAAKLVSGAVSVFLLLSIFSVSGEYLALTVSVISLVHLEQRLFVRCCCLHAGSKCLKLGSAGHLWRQWRRKPERSGRDPPTGPGAAASCSASCAAHQGAEISVRPKLLFIIEQYLTAAIRSAHPCDQGAALCVCEAMLCHFDTCRWTSQSLCSGEVPAWCWVAQLSNLQAQATTTC